MAHVDHKALDGWVSHPWLSCWSGGSQRTCRGRTHGPLSRAQPWTAHVAELPRADSARCTLPSTLASASGSSVHLRKFFAATSCVPDAFILVYNFRDTVTYVLAETFLPNSRHSKR